MVHHQIHHYVSGQAFRIFRVVPVLPIRIRLFIMVNQSSTVGSHVEISQTVFDEGVDIIERQRTVFGKIFFHVREPKQGLVVVWDSFFMCSNPDDIFRILVQCVHHIVWHERFGIVFLVKEPGGPTSFVDQIDPSVVCT